MKATEGLSGNVSGKGQRAALHVQLVVSGSPDDANFMDLSHDDYAIGVDLGTTSIYQDIATIFESRHLYRRKLSL